jgi:Fe2+ transport system protein B
MKQAKGLEVDARSLSRDLGIPAIAITARAGEGIHTLLGAVADVIEGKIVTKPLRVGGTPEFQKAVSELVPMIEQMAPGIPNARWLAIRLLDGDARVQKALSTGELGDIVSRQQRRLYRFSGRCRLRKAVKIYVSERNRTFVLCGVVEGQVIKIVEYFWQSSFDFVPRRALVTPLRT